MIQCTVWIFPEYVGNGVGAMSVPSQQSIKLTLPVQVMPGIDTVTAGNLNTLGTAIGTAAQTALNANLALIKGWTSGNP